jgi:hypothetical protein
MPRIYLPLLPLPVLAVLVAASACSKPRSEETTHLIPPPAPYVLPSSATPSPVLPAAPQEKPAAPADEAPTAEDVKEFERPVMK